MAKRWCGRGAKELPSTQSCRNAKRNNLCTVARRLSEILSAPQGALEERLELLDDVRRRLGVELFTNAAAVVPPGDAEEDFAGGGVNSNTVK